MSFGADLVGWLQSDALYIVVILLVFAAIGLGKGFFSRLGAFWGWAGFAVVLVVLGAFLLLADPAYDEVAAIFLVLGVLILVVSAIVPSRRAGGSRR